LARGFDARDIIFLQNQRNHPDEERMEITTKQFKHCDLVSVKGRVDSATAPKLTLAFETLANDGRFKIVLDLNEAEYMSSAGFRAILSAYKNCKRYNRGDLVLVNLPAPIRSSLELTGMTGLFRHFDDITEAVGSF
jgi:anti-sigma B factor antagonist